MKPILKGVICDIHPSVKFGKDVTIWSFVVICMGTEIGDNCVIGSGVYIGKNCKIGNGVRIQDKSHITERMTIEDNVFVGAGVITTDDKYPVVLHPNYHSTPPYFEEWCSIGAGSIILPGVRIGSGAMIGAGSVVTGSVQRGMVVVGCPARKLFQGNLNE